MPSFPGISSSLCAIIGLACMGCYSPYRPATYSPYGPGVPVYNGPPVMQPQFGPPVGTPTIVDPNNGGFPPSGSTFTPGTGGTFDNNSIAPVPDPGANSFPPTGNSFPPSNGGGFGSSTSPGFDPSLPANPGTGGGGLVPPYGEPGGLSAPRGGNTFENNVTPFGPDGAAFQQDVQVQPVGFSVNTNESGVSFKAGESGVRLANHVGNAGQPESLLAYDNQGYRWLRGVVDRDDQTGAWILVYDLTPTKDDRYGGQITLVPSPLTSKLRNNDVVLVEGQIDMNQSGSGIGEPQFHITSMQGPFAQLNLNFARSMTMQ